MSEYLTSLQRDSLSRNRIVTETHQNFFVEASAGSGKTTMLVNRMLAMVEAGTDISKICAITFTKAAANEFYRRFQKGLIERSSAHFENKEMPGQLPAPTDLTRKRCADALQNIDLCFMGTIDSFCSMVLSEHPYEAGIPYDSVIAPDSEVKTLCRREYAKICDGEYHEALASDARVFRSLHGNAEDVFIRGIARLMESHAAFCFQRISSTDIDIQLKEVREQLISLVRFLHAHTHLKHTKPQKDNEKAWAYLDDILTNISKPWGNHLYNVMNAFKTLSKIRLVPEAMNHHALLLEPFFVPTEKRGDWLELDNDWVDALNRKMRDVQYLFSMSFLEKCVPIVAQAMREKGCLTFFHTLYYLRNMLKADAADGGALIEHIHHRHSYFLIDEFQDTNPLQAEVFFYLTAQNPTEKWTECTPKQGSLFIVGDPKQSIYRFRGADVSSFLKVKRLFEAGCGSVLTLSRNFRSGKPLCHYFNRVFTELLPEESLHQSRYEEIPVPEAADQESGNLFEGVYHYHATIHATGKTPADQADPVKIADIIERLVDGEEYRIRYGENEDLRPVRCDDIMVITAMKKDLFPIMSQLNMRGIPARVEGAVEFGDNDALREIHRIYCALADHDDQLALYGAMTGRLLSLSDDEIAQYKARGGFLSLKLPSDPNAFDDTDPVCSRLEQLKSLSRKARGLSPAALFSKIMDDFKIFRFVDAENLEVLYYTLELLRNAEKNGQIVSHKDGAAYMRTLISGEADEERCLSLNAGENRVHMANLHKVKGLEAPIVILAGASERSSTTPGARIEHTDDGTRGYLFALPSEHVNALEYHGFPDKMEIEQDANAAENIRLLYVAATRAKNALILCNSVSEKKNDTGCKWAPIIESDLLDFFEHTEEPPEKHRDEGRPFSADTLYAQAESECVLNNRSIQESTYTLKNPSRLKLVSKLSDDQEPHPVAESHPFPALLGTMVHKLMEILVSTKNNVDAGSAVGEIMREYSTPDIAPHQKELSAALLKVAEHIRTGGYPQSNGLPQDILGELLRADEVFCEVPFCYVDDTDDCNAVWNGIMDVVYCTNGEWHIVDYKTNADGSDLDTKYQAQLSAYVKAFKATTGQDADARTYHIRIPGE